MFSAAEAPVMTKLLSKRCLKVAKLLEFFTIIGSSFHLFTTLWLKKFHLISSLLLLAIVFLSNVISLVSLRSSVPVVRNQVLESTASSPLSTL